jgi:hypothetical protein
MRGGRMEVVGGYAVDQARYGLGEPDKYGEIA